jgi:glutaredoxin
MRDVLAWLWPGARRRAAALRAGVGGPATDVMYQPRHVRLFIKPYCGWCRQAMDWLEARQIRYQVLDVTRDAEAYEAMFRLSRQTLAPVIEVDGNILADFGARELAAFWQELGDKPVPPPTRPS